ncbi:putative eukaryotic protein of unknown function (DUF1764) [Lyophyllum shimeji]|uniref:DUF1764-domain-containing protein n=1 Tax=Lyophyllum shimeji TaxID=47721 RepID=A0A9P3UMG4_LYOSH|nr:putative eukaryotic protein of unknown function (DUF1764) [Lyophyllum shimeji]
MSEIDDIFASKGKAPAIQSVASGSSLPPKKKTAKDKKRKRDSELSNNLPKDQPSRPAPETVIDPSTLVSSVKRPKIEKKSKVSKTSAKEADLADESKFTDSRGSRRRKTTEEGWAIYKEDELGIREDGGDTPLCPFDCDCCF